MLPEQEEIARQLAIMVDLHPEKTTSQIAAELMLPPLFIINAIRVGKEMELLTEDKEADKLTLISKPQLFFSPESLGVEMFRLLIEMRSFLEAANADKSDIEMLQLKYFLRGVAPSSIDIAVYALLHMDIIEVYQLEDPGDKESVYEFISLKGNGKHKWGNKQFKKVETSNGKTSK